MLPVHPWISIHPPTLRPPRNTPFQGGGLYTIFELTAAWHGSITHAMLRLLPALAHRNSFVKNLARQGGLLPLLFVVTKGCFTSHPLTAVSLSTSSLGLHGLHGQHAQHICAYSAYLIFVF